MRRLLPRLWLVPCCDLCSDDDDGYNRLENLENTISLAMMATMAADGDCMLLQSIVPTDINLLSPMCHTYLP